MVGGVAGLIFFAMLGLMVLGTPDGTEDSQEQFNVIGVTVIGGIAVILIVAFLIGSSMNYGS